MSSRGLIIKTIERGIAEGEYSVGMVLIKVHIGC